MGALRGVIRCRLSQCLFASSLNTLQYTTQEHVERNLPMTIMGICGVFGAVALMLMRNPKGNASSGGSSNSGRSTSSSSIADDKR